MKINTFYELWRALRFYAIALAIIIFVVMSCLAHCFTLEMDYRGPGSEIEAFERECRDRENQEAHERVQNDRESSERDRERSREFERDHAA